MKELEIIGYKRANLGKSESKALRADSLVPCVLYGGKEQVHFSVPMILFREMVYTPNVYIVKLNIEGDIYKCILQDVQFHPVSEMILHADFLQVFEDKIVKMEIPIKTVGTAPGVIAGGRIAVKQAKLKIAALPKDFPDYVEVDLSNLNIGDSFRVKHAKADGLRILHNPMLPIVSIASTRASRSAESTAGK